MTRIGFAACLMLVAAGLQGCSLNPFSRPERGPSFGTEPAAAGSTAPAKRVREAAALKRFDANGDGNITKPELEQTLTADFKKEDANADATLDAGEARALNERLRQERNLSPVFDWNADGRLVYAEFATQWRTLFERADRDRDGVVSDDEMQGPSERTPRPIPKPEMSRVDPTHVVP